MKRFFCTFKVAKFNIAEFCVDGLIFALFILVISLFIKLITNCFVSNFYIKIVGKTISN